MILAISTDLNLAEPSHCEIQTAEEENGEEGDQNPFITRSRGVTSSASSCLILSSRLSNIAFEPHHETKSG